MCGRSIVLVLAGLTGITSTRTADAHSWYRAALAEKLDAHVNCQACHLSRGRAVELPPAKKDLFRIRSKSFYNEFGEKFVPLLQSSEIAEEIDFIYQLRRRGSGAPASPEAIQELRELRERAGQELLKVLPKVEAMRDPSSSKTYGELLRAGELEGIRLRGEPRRMPSDR